MKRNFSETYVGFGHCSECRKRKALRKVEKIGKWICRRCSEDGPPAEREDSRRVPTKRRAVI